MSPPYAAWLTTNEVIDTAAPDEIATLFRLTSQPDVPTEKSNTRVPPDVTRLPHVAVPVLFALLSSVMALALLEPPDAAANAVAFSVISASSTWAPSAVSASVGCVPL